MSELSPTVAIDLDRVRERLHDSQEHVRLVELTKLMEAGESAEPAIELLAERLSDSSVTVRKLTVVVLGRIGAQAISVLVCALDAQQPTPVRVAAASGLASIGPEAFDAVEPLCQCLQSDEELLRTNAGIALSKIGEESVPALRTALKSPEINVLLAAVKALGWIGSKAKDAVKDLQNVSSMDSPMLSMAASAALVKITENPSTGLPALLEALENGDESARKTAVECIGEIGESARKQAPVLREHLSDPAPEVRAAAALAIARIKADDEPSVEALQQLMDDDDAEVRKHAAIALASFEQSVANESSESAQQDGT